MSKNDMSETLGFPMKWLVRSGLAVVALVVTMLMVGINDNGQRTVVQVPTGHTFVKFTPGIYFSMFGSTTEYNDVITVTLDENNAIVRYQDGGQGWVEGIVRATLPTSEAEMLKLHRAVRSTTGLKAKILLPEVQQALNLTAGLMTSEEAYAVKRNQYREWGMDQLKNGTYKTVLTKKPVTIEGKQVMKEVPAIAYVNGDGVTTMHNASPFGDYGMDISGFQITEWGFEKATREQISDKRSAEMAVITAKANAIRAKEETLQAAAEGEKDVITAKFAEEKKNQPAIAAAAKDLEVAKLAVAKEQENAAAAIFYKKAVDTRSSADAAAKKRMMQADGALEQKLAAYIKVNANYAKEFGKQKWVSEITMGGSGQEGSSAADMINLLTIKTAKDLNFNPQPSK